MVMVRATPSEEGMKEEEVGVGGGGECAVEAEGVLRVHEPRVGPAFGSDRVSVCICISLVSQSHM